MSTTNIAAKTTTGDQHKVAIELMTANLALWNRNRTPDPNYTKKFSRGGGFSGTAVNATYLARLATAEFGPVGIGWGLEVEKEEYIDGAPIIVNDKVVCREQVHVLQVRLWYKQGESVGNVVQYGQTTFIGKNKYGPFTDEEAPKKSMTDAMSKCLSLLGFSSDVYLGLFDDNKYVNDAQQAYADQKPMVSVNGTGQADGQEQANPAQDSTARQAAQSRQAASTGQRQQAAPTGQRQQAPAQQQRPVEQADAISDEELAMLEEKLSKLNQQTDESRIKTAISMASTLFKSPAAIKRFIEACNKRIAALDPFPV